METGHGGNRHQLARQSGRAPGEILDFSANINPIGPPPWLRQVISRALEEVVHYPDPESRALVEAASRRFGTRPEEIVVGNGSSELLFALCRALGPRDALIPVPSYIDYTRAAEAAGLAVRPFPLGEPEDFALDPAALGAAATGDPVVFLGQPNNPTGILLPSETLRALARAHPRALWIADEAFADFIPGFDSLIRDRPDNAGVLYSLTKFFAIPGLRLGLAFLPAELARKTRAQLSPWSVNTLSQAVGARALQDEAYARETRAAVERWREDLAARLSNLPGLKVYPSPVNFLLLRLDRPEPCGTAIADALLSQGIAVRVCANFQGLSDRFLRVAVRTPAENLRLADALAGCLDLRRARLRPGGAEGQGARAIMFQGTSSNAGKSVLTAGLCRVLLQEGLRVAPFKAQNMSLNSFVTRDGGEMGRAQVVQAQACRLEPDLRMNPVLLKPSSDIGSQVIVLGRSVGHMNAARYYDYKPTAQEAALRAYDSLAAEFDVVVLEGAGSPGEVNLKRHDIVNMAMARHARAPVLIVGDIDRGGVFASFVGLMEVMEEWERKLVAGFVVNRFRGDASLLGPAFRYVEEHTGRPTLGVVPHLETLGLPEEDSVTFKAQRSGDLCPRPDQVLIAALSLPHISNFTDLDALRLEPDVCLRVVTSLVELGEPDAVLVPGSKNIAADLGWLRESGLAAALGALSARGHTELVGICGGFQMLGRAIRDPLAVEGPHGEGQGLGLLDIETVFLEQKTLSRVTGRHLPSDLAIHGYEIHHGQTRLLGARPVVQDDLGAVLGAARADGAVWGTYVHGLFDADPFRRWFVDRLRQKKGLAPLGAVQAVFDLEPALDRLAEVLRRHLDLKAIFALLGR